MSKLGLACYTIRALKPYMSQETIRMTVMSYDVIFWGNCPQSINIFWVKKRVIRIITNTRSGDSCRELRN
jgi:hypothetical protein